MNKSQREQRGQARVKMPVRNQMELRELSLDQWLDVDHRVRIVWEFVESLDLSSLYDKIRATKHRVGRDAIDPRILFALWLFATIEGETSARRLAELTCRDIPYMWICGGVSVNYHRLADFRTEAGELLEEVLTQSIAVLINQDLIELKTVAQDGMRVRASAGSSSFRRSRSLDEAYERAKQHVEDVKKKAEDETDGGNRRRQAAAERAAEEKFNRVANAREEMTDLQARYQKRQGTPRSEPRASTTDPQARRMKMPDGGTRPAMNVQFASDGDTQMVVLADVTNQGSDSGLMQPIYEDVCERYQKIPKEYLVDGGFTKRQDVTKVEQNGTTVYGGLYAEEKQKAAGKDPYAPKAGDTPEMAAFRVRMGTTEARKKYRRRAAIAEFPNAECRNRGLTQFRVRGLIKAKAQTLWHVIAYNFLRMRNLRCPVRKQSYLDIVMQT